MRAKKVADLILSCDATIVWFNSSVKSLLPLHSIVINEHTWISRCDNLADNELNETIKKFGYPENVLAEHEHWVVLLRPQQVTAGSVVLACKQTATSLADVSPTAYSELPGVIGSLEATLKRCFEFNKINYLALMMVDKEVHFHVLPRYSAPRHIAGVTFVDKTWPKPADLSRVTEMSHTQFKELYRLLKDNWT